MLKELLLEKRRKRKKPYSSKTYTTGDPAYNIAQFNKRMGTGDGKLPFGGLKFEQEINKEAEKAAEAADTILAQSPDGGNTVSFNSGEAASEGSGESGGMSESLALEEKATVNFIDLTDEIIKEALDNLFSSGDDNINRWRTNFIRVTYTEPENRADYSMSSFKYLFDLFGEPIYKVFLAPAETKWGDCNVKVNPESKNIYVGIQDLDGLEKALEVTFSVYRLSPEFRSAPKFVTLPLSKLPFDFWKQNEAGAAKILEELKTAVKKVVLAKSDVLASEETTREESRIAKIVEEIGQLTPEKDGEAAALKVFQSPDVFNVRVDTLYNQGKFSLPDIVANNLNSKNPKIAEALFNKDTGYWIKFKNAFNATKQSLKPEFFDIEYFTDAARKLASKNETKISDAYDYLNTISEEEREEIKDWLREHISNIHFIVPTVQPISGTPSWAREPSKNTLDKYAAKWKWLENNFFDNYPAVEAKKDLWHYRNAYTDADDPKNYFIWNLGGKVVFDLAFNDPEFPPKIKAILEALKLRTKSATEIKEEKNSIDSLPAALAILKLFDGDINFFTKHRKARAAETKPRAAYKKRTPKTDSVVDVEPYDWMTK